MTSSNKPVFVIVLFQALSLSLATPSYAMGSGSALERIGSDISVMTEKITDGTETIQVIGGEVERVLRAAGPTLEAVSEVVTLARENPGKTVLVCILGTAAGVLAVKKTVEFGEQMINWGINWVRSCKAE